MPGSLHPLTYFFWAMRTIERSGGLILLRLRPLSSRVILSDDSASGESKALRYRCAHFAIAAHTRFDEPTLLRSGNC